MICKSSHRNWPFFEQLVEDQGGYGRHKCAGCAYERGYQAGLQRLENINLDIHSLPESQAKTVRHKSPHAAFALGYLDGVSASYGMAPNRR